MPQHVWDTKAISNAASQRGPAGNFPALSITPTPQDPRSRRLLLRPPSQDQARPAGPELQPPPLSPSSRPGWVDPGG